MDALRFRIRHADGKVDEFLTESPRVLVGSGAHCEVRLRVGEAEVEHVLVQSTPAGLRAIARSFEPPPRLDGVDFTEAPIRGRTVLAIDALRIEIVPVQTSATTDTSKRSAGRINPRIMAYLVLGIGGSLAMLAAKARSRAADALEPAAPTTLWTAAPSCPQANPEQARALAEERLQLAQSKQERSPFHPEDGVAAVPLYQLVSSCLRVAGDEEDASDATATAGRLQQRAMDDLRIHRIRLHRALDRREWASAEREVGLLSALVGSTGGEYATWLSNLGRKLQIAYGSGKSK